MAGYYYGNKIDTISELVGDIESALTSMTDELNFLEGVDWDELDEFLVEEIRDSIGSIRNYVESLNE